MGGRKPERRNLRTVRAASMKDLPEKLRTALGAQTRKGPVFNPQSGATIVGAREFLIAYNFNLNTRDRKPGPENRPEPARERPGQARQGRRHRQGPRGNTVKVPGKFKEVKSVGWYVEDYGVAQDLGQLHQLQVTPIHVVFDEAGPSGRKLGLRVTGSELSGLIPRKPCS